MSQRTVSLTLTDHAFIALHQAVGRYVDHLDKGRAERPETLMLRTAAAEAREAIDGACPDHLLGVLRINRESVPASTGARESVPAAEPTPASGPKRKGESDSGR